MKQYYVYIIKCSDSSYYTGVTNSIERRLYEHNLGRDKRAYTFSKRPVELVWFEIFSDINEAIIIEKKVKGWSRKKKEALINEDWDKLILFSKNYTEYGKPKI
ncbi:MAG: GIY-YIG nuclease family protein [Lutibacter sp.]|uniref:GIY-YIG nuclease family protein n=1 Tax=Lutibacter sp. TaxID=1925666 RepID=UPI0038592415